jgi:hypothetical protein
MARTLLTRLAVVYDERAAGDVMAPTARVNWRPGTFGTQFPGTVRTIATHQTAGWPSRQAARNFVARYTTQNYTEDGNDKWGFGPQFYISTNGTAFRLIDIPLITAHATFINEWAVGVETGRTYRDIGPAVNHAWRALSSQNEDAPGMKLYAIAHPGNPIHEVLVVWFTTNNYDGPGRTPISDGEMLFTEWQYRTWALLARYLTGEWFVPRTLPLLPYENRSDNIDDPVRFRRIVLADNGFEMIWRGLSAFNVTDTDFQLANFNDLQTDYTASRLSATGFRARHNQIWLHFFDSYRGLHGHGFSGAINRVFDSHHNLVPADHDCPGPLFDWHRLYREMSDWWWRPFDFDSGFTTTAVPIRKYQKARRDTPLIEYYFETIEINYFDRITPGLGGAGFSPDTYRLEEGAPVYAMANGELVAARFPEPADGVSMAFVLVRHEVYHLKSIILHLFAEELGLPPTASDMLDYDKDPSYVYSLTMHIGRPDGLNFDQAAPGNPDWLNRVLLRLKECELGIAFHDGGTSGIAETAWRFNPAGSELRPSILEGWRFDQNHSLRQFANDLKAGKLALAPHVTDTWATPIKIILGDYLGNAGRISAPDLSTDMRGIHVEVFSTDLISPLDFSAVTTASDWTVPPGLPNPPALKYQSEWAKVPSDHLKAILDALGIDPTLVNWWQEVCTHLLSDMMLPISARLPWNGVVWHYRPHDFLRWLNIATWRSEWPKYRVTIGGNPAPAPLVPRPRRV